MPRPDAQAAAQVVDAPRCGHKLFSRSRVDADKPVVGWTTEPVKDDRNRPH